jgi:NTP pyrophosphatase (non-canonical NTP hydrolase)
MDLNTYQQSTRATAVYPHAKSGNLTAINYCVLGAAAESGQLPAAWQQAIRDGDFTVAKEQLRYELGDVLWYLARLADELGMTLEQVAQSNREKLTDRKARNRLGGTTVKS